MIKYFVVQIEYISSQYTSIFFRVYLKESKEKREKTRKLEKREDQKNVDSVQNSRVRIPQLKEKYLVRIKVRGPKRLTGVTLNEINLDVNGIVCWKTE